MDISSLGYSLVRGMVPTAIADGIGSATGKALIAPLEDASEKPAELMKQCLIDEGPETFFKTIISRVCVEASKVFTPFVPEQIVIIPTQLLGSLIHWVSASGNSLNVSSSSGGNGSDSPLAKLHKKLFMTPLGWVFNKIGMGEENGKIHFFKFGLTQIGLLSVCGLLLKGQENENIPGVNINHEDPILTTLLKTLGYTVVEQTTQVASQAMRYYIDYKKEFGENIMAKTLTNVINEKLIPGNVPSALLECFSTYTLGRFIPRSLAAAIGEIPGKAIDKFLTVRLRRSTKHAVDENGNRIPNHRLNSGANRFLESLDGVLDRARNFAIEKVIAKAFLPEGRNIDEFTQELKGSLDIDTEKLVQKREKKKAENAAETPLNTSA